jgi:DDE family transposase
LRQPNFQARRHAVWQSVPSPGEPAPRHPGIVDAIGLEARHVSRHFVWRAGYRRFPRRRWPKLTLVGEAQTHLMGGAVTTWGPSQDSPQFPTVLRQAAHPVHWDRMIADTAYDAEHNHRLCREQLGIRSTVIPLNQRRGRRWPKTSYRRQMKRRFFRQVYHQRWQIESLISRHKRRLGSALHSRIWRTQKQECLLRVLTHNLMLLACDA